MSVEHYNLQQSADIWIEHRNEWAKQISRPIEIRKHFHSEMLAWWIKFYCDRWESDSTTTIVRAIDKFEDMPLFTIIGILEKYCP